LSSVFHARVPRAPRSPLSPYTTLFRSDMGSGIAVNAFGLADEPWIAAVTAQLGKLQHSSNLYYTEPDALLAEQLCERTGMKKVRSEEHTSELQSRFDLVCRLLLEKKKQ